MYSVLKSEDCIDPFDFFHCTAVLGIDKTVVRLGNIALKSMFKEVFPVKAETWVTCKWYLQQKCNLCTVPKYVIIVFVCFKRKNQNF